MKTHEEWKAYYRAHYHANKEKWREKRTRYEAGVRAQVLAAKDRPCADCGGRWDPRVMEFDHLPGTEKELTLGTARARKYGWDRMQKEIAKCEVVCPTCHRIRTLRRMGLLD